MTTSQSLHELWDEEAAATERIRGRFGLQQALDYLVGEKLVYFLRLARHDATVANELPAFVAHIRRLFTPDELRQYPT